MKITIWAAMSALVGTAFAAADPDVAALGDFTVTALLLTAAAWGALGALVGVMVHSFLNGGPWWWHKVDVLAFTTALGCVLGAVAGLADPTASVAGVIGATLLSGALGALIGVLIATPLRRGH